MLFNISSSSNQPPRPEEGRVMMTAPEKKKKKSFVKRMKAFCQTHSKKTVWARQPNMHCSTAHGERPLRIDCSLFSRKIEKLPVGKEKGGKWKSVSLDHLLDIRALWRDEFEFPPHSPNRRNHRLAFPQFLSVDDDDDPIVWRNVRKDHHTYRQQQQQEEQLYS